MEIYLPIAGISVNIIYLVTSGLVSGIFSGLFGIGGGFIITSFLIFMGISPAIAVSSSSNQIIASSVSGFLFYYKKRLLDLKLAIVMSIGASIGSILGIAIFHYLVLKNFFDLFIIVSYISVFGTNSFLILLESLRSIMRKEKGEVKSNSHKNLQNLKVILPFATKFKYIPQRVSVIIPAFAGFIAGILVALMGVGGGFIVVPVMIYILKVPTKIAIGTSLFLIVITSTIVTFLQAVNHNTVDIILVWVMSSGAVFGALIGGKLNTIIQPVYLRLSLAVIMMLVVFRVIFTTYKTSPQLETLNASNLINNDNLFSKVVNLSFTAPYNYALLSVVSAILIGLLGNFLTQALMKLLRT
jgi:uncharacterized membrane protein YfcA